MRAAGWEARHVVERVPRRCVSCETTAPKQPASLQGVCAGEDREGHDSSCDEVRLQEASTPASRTAAAQRLQKSLRAGMRRPVTLPLPRHGTLLAQLCHTNVIAEPNKQARRTPSK